jgi:hypothetical protein
MRTAADWRIAFAKQAKADLRAREALEADKSIPACQSLHFLQMACEKVCKAYLYGQPGRDPGELKRGHAYVAKQLPQIARQQLRREAGKVEKWVIAEIARLARRIELLAPAVDDGGASPANCEYPWLDASGRIVVPADHSCGIDLRGARAGRTLLKVLYRAVDELAGVTPLKKTSSGGS